ncbi:MAG TPA: TadE/TadG family type IV pilus assembly protein [Caulobacteraceae bacterium]
MNDAGATAVELAFILPLFLVLVFGVFEFARLMWTREALAQTAAAGARCMAMSASSCQSSGAYSSSGATAYIDGVAANWGLTLTASNLTLNNAATCSGITTPKGFSTASISYTFVSVVPKEIVALAGGESLSTSACYPNE